MLTGRTLPQVFRWLAATAAALSMLVLSVACSGSSRTPMSSDTRPVQRQLRLLTGVGIAGVQLELVHDPGVFLTAADPVDGLAGGTCELNSSGSLSRVACLAAGTFDAPSVVLDLSFQRPAHVSFNDTTGEPSCRTTDSLGNVTPVACELF